MNFDLRAPLTTMFVTDGWPSTRSADTGGERIHGGVDLRATPGTPAYAASSGRVIFGGQYNDGTGGAVELDHGDGMVTRYLHLSRVDVRSGQTVAAGQQIGLTGAHPVTSPHLHFDAWVLDSKLPEYVSRFGQAAMLGSLAKTWPGGRYIKVPAEPLAPMTLREDVMLADKVAGVSFYRPINQFIAIAILGLGGYLMYKLVTQNSRLFS